MSFLSAKTVLLIWLLTLLSSSPVCGDQSANLARVAVLPLANAQLEEAFRSGLKDVGLVEGRNVAIDWWRFEVTDANLRSLPAELQQSKHDVIVALGSQLTHLAMQSKLAPVAFVVGDPIAAGFADSLAKPGKNGTGVSVVTTDLDQKRLELLKIFAPKARRMAYLRNPTNFPGRRSLDSAAQTLGVELVRLNAKNTQELDAILQTLGDRKIDGLLVSGDLMLLQNKAKIAAAVRETRLPALFPWRDYHDEVVVASYAPSLTEAMRRAARYVGEVLKGTKASEIPIEQISEYELTVDLRVARAMGIRVPEDLLLRADKVIR
jgi:putative ABC transport system substrate-binding protein